MLYLILSAVSASEVLLLYEESVYSSGYQHTMRDTVTSTSQ